MQVGVISDTHGLLRPGVFPAFAGVEQILHAGDVGPIDILAELESVAPVVAVYGNTDGFDLRSRIPDVVELEFEGLRTVLLHGDQLGVPTPEQLAEAYPGVDLVIYGHTHRPLVRQVGSTTILNPGSAGPRRFTLPATVMVLEIEGGHLTPRTVTLDD